MNNKDQLIKLLKYKDILEAAGVSFTKSIEHYNGDYEKIYISMIRKTLPEFVARDLVSVQPMTGIPYETL